MFIILHIFGPSEFDWVQNWHSMKNLGTRNQNHLRITSLRFWDRVQLLVCVFLCLIVRPNKEQWLKIWTHCQPQNKIFISGVWQIRIRISFQTRSALKAFKYSIISRPLRLLQSDGIRHHSVRPDRCLFLSCYVTKVTYETPLPPTPDHFITAVLGLMALQLGEINQAQNTLQSVLRSAGAGCERREGTEPEQTYHWNRFLWDLDSFRCRLLWSKEHSSSSPLPTHPPLIRRPLSPPLHQLFSLWVSSRSCLQNWFPRDATLCCCELL